MANSQGLCYSFKLDLLKAEHNFGTSSATRGSTAADTFRFALFLQGGSLTPSTVTAYGTAPANANEVAATGNYVAGGGTPGNATAAAPTLDGSAAVWSPGASVTWTGVTFTNCDCALLYNTSRSNKAVGVYTFGAQSPSAGNFTLTMPPQSAGSALVQVS